MKKVFAVLRAALSVLLASAHLLHKAIMGNISREGDTNEMKNHFDFDPKSKYKAYLENDGYKRQIN